MAIVKVCGGDMQQWRDHWTQIQRALDQGAPHGMERPVTPPWAHRVPPAGLVPPRRPRSPRGLVPADAGRPPQPHDPLDGWFIESFTALLRLDTEPVEALEHRVVVSTVDGLSELATSVSVPRHPDDAGEAHRLDSELLYGGSLELREQPYESYFRNVIVLPRPLRPGEKHKYALRLRIPPGQPMAPHYVHVPLRRSDHFDLRVRFDPQHRPRAVWVLRAAPTAVISEREPAAETVLPDRFGEVQVSFGELRPASATACAGASDRPAGTCSRPDTDRIATRPPDGPGVSLTVPDRDRPGTAGERGAAQMQPHFIQFLLQLLGALV